MDRETLLQGSTDRLRAQFPAMNAPTARWAATVVLKTLYAEYPAIELAAEDEAAGRSVTNYWWLKAAKAKSNDTTTRHNDGRSRGSATTRP